MGSLYKKQQGGLLCRLSGGQIGRDTLTADFTLNAIDILFHVGFPNLPDLSHQVWAGFERHFAWFPTGGGGFFAARGAHVLESLNLAHGLGELPPDWRGEHFHSLDHAIWVDDEPAAQFDALVLIPNAVGSSNVASLVGGHVEGDAAFNHFRKLVVVPHLMDKVAVHADRDHFNAQFLQHRIFVSDR